MKLLHCVRNNRGRDPFQHWLWQPSSKIYIFYGTFEGGFYAVKCSFSLFFCKLLVHSTCYYKVIYNPSVLPLHILAISRCICWPHEEMQPLRDHPHIKLRKYPRNSNLSQRALLWSWIVLKWKRNGLMASFSMTNWRIWLPNYTSSV